MLLAAPTCGTAEAVGNALKLNRHLWLVSPLYGALFAFRPATNLITAAHQGASGYGKGMQEAWGMAWALWRGMRSSSCSSSP